MVRRPDDNDNLETLMAATVIINEWNSTASQTDKTSGTVRFKNANNSTVDSGNPLVIPTGANREYSYEKWLRLQITGTPPSEKIDALEFYTDGGNGFGSGVELWAEVESSGVFRTPVVPDESNSPPQAGSASLTMTSAFAYTAGGTLSLGAGSYSASSTHIGNFVVLVMEVTAGASQGVLTSETVTFEYDEI